MDKKILKKYIISWSIFGVVFIITTLLILFYLDLANGPLYLLILALIFLAGLIGARIFLFKKKFWIRNSPWGVLLIALLVIGLLAHPSVERKSAVFYDNPVPTEVLSLKNGKVRGVYNADKSVEVYAGIPYAEAPVGEYRWKEPRPVNDWEGIKDCSYFSPRSMQADSSPIINSLVDMYAMKGWHPNYNMVPLEPTSEDSLYLNIWRPANMTGNLPIVVYIHGGSLTTGSGSYDKYNGETFAKNGVIMITINYRLGIFGYFAHPSLKEESPNKTTGNYGLLDQIEALRWINANASYFGGDSSNITIAGESAGSSSVSALCTSPLASGLFKYAIGESSSLVVNKKPPHTFRKLEDAYKVAVETFKEFNVSSISELRNIKAEDLVKTKFANDGMTLDGYALTKMPYEVYQENASNEVALLNGYNILEADAFVVPQFLFSPTNKNNIKDRLESVFGEKTTLELMDLYKDRIDKDAFSVFNEIFSIYWLIYPHHSWSNMEFNNSKPVYRYQFTKENGFYGTYHSGELEYAYGNLDKSNHQFAYNEEDYALSEKMVKYWTNFAKTGNPNGEGLPTWEEYNPNNENVMELGKNVGTMKDKYLATYRIIESYLDTLE